MYKVSVITPFHNVELNIFEKAYQSMKSQTIGFENIQWIVIAHNCEPHYLPAIPTNRPYQCEDGSSFSHGSSSFMIAIKQGQFKEITANKDTFSPIYMAIGADKIPNNWYCRDYYSHRKFAAN